MNATQDENTEPAGGARAWLDKPWIVLLLMLLCSAILLRANYDKPFYNFDDEEHFRHATGRSVGSLLFNFKTDYTYLPLSALSLRLDRALFGPPQKTSLAENSNAGYVQDTGVRSAEELNYFGDTNWAPPVRIESGIYHALVGFILWLFLRRLRCGGRLALLVAAAWAVHPMACESVCWISERKNVLAALFGFAALLAQTCRGKSWRWPLTIFCYLLCILSKPTGVGFFPVAVALEFLEGSDAGFRFDFSPARRRAAAGLIGLLLLTLAITALGLNSHKQFFVSHPGGTLFTALLTDLEFFVRYSFNILLPVDLSFFYGIEPVRSLGDMRVWYSGAILVLLFTAALWLCPRKYRALSLFGILWFFGAMGPAANIAPIPYWMQDRYAYFGAPGLLLCAALAVRGALERLRQERNTAVAGAAFVIMLAALSWSRSPLFADAYKLVADAAQRQARSGMAHLTYGRNYFVNISNNAAHEYQNSAAKRTDTMRALDEFEAAMRTPDIDNFCDVYELRVTCAELMAGAEMNAEARAYLKNWLPPGHLRMLEPGEAWIAAYQGSAYKPQTLAYAWLVMSIARYNQAAQRRFEGASYTEIMELARDALSEAKRSVAVHVWAYQGFILKAKILIFLARLERGAGHNAEADALIGEARTALEKVPAHSDFGPLAADMRANLNR